MTTVVPEGVIRLSISGMTCAGCIATVENALKNVPGVTEATVNFAEHTATVTGAADPQVLITAVRAASYDAAVLRGLDDESEKEAAERTHYRRLLRKFMVAAAVGAPLMAAERIGILPHLDAPGVLPFWLAVAAVSLFVLVYSAGHMFVGAWKSFRAHNASMDTLIATLVTPGYSAWWCFSPHGAGSARHAYFEAAAIIIAISVRRGNAPR